MVFCKNCSQVVVLYAVMVTAQAPLVLLQHVFNKNALHLPNQPINFVVNHFVIYQLLKKLQS